MKKFLFVLSFQFLVLLFPIGAHAHILSTDGEVGAVMHIDPDDDPVAGIESVFYFQLKDKSDTFDFSQCECVFSVIQNGKEIASEPIVDGGEDGLTLHVSYTFPVRDVYTLKVLGRPTTQGAFNSFELSYDIRVERQSNQTSTNTLPVYQLFFGIVILVITLLLIFFRKFKKG